jgi:hypothetical protein
VSEAFPKRQDIMWGACPTPSATKNFPSASLQGLSALSIITTAQTRPSLRAANCPANHTQRAGVLFIHTDPPTKPLFKRDATSDDANEVTRLSFAMRLTSELIHDSLSYLNPLKERELDLRGAFMKRADATYFLFDTKKQILILKS